MYISSVASGNDCDNGCLAIMNDVYSTRQDVIMLYYHVFYTVTFTLSPTHLYCYICSC